MVVGGEVGVVPGMVQWMASSTPNKDILLDLVPQDEAGFVPSNGLHNGGYQRWPGYFMAGGGAHTIYSTSHYTIDQMLVKCSVVEFICHAKNIYFVYISLL